MGEGRGAWGLMSNPVWHDKFAVPVFRDNNGGEAGPWKPVKIFPEINPGAARTLSMKSGLTSCLLSHRVPTNAVSPPTLAEVTATVQTSEPLCKQRGAVLQVRALVPGAPQHTGYPPFQAQTVIEPLNSLALPVQPSKCL